MSDKVSVPGSTLKVDPEKARAFNQRGRGSLTRNGRRPKLANGVADRHAREAFKRAVTRLPCARCGNKRGNQAHHVLAQQHIKSHVQGLRLADNAAAAKLLRRLLWDPDNGLSLCERCHHRHEYTPGGRLPREMVPAAAWAFARRLGSWAVARLERDYPEAT